MFLSFKRLTIESQYNKKVVDRLKEYEVIWIIWRNLKWR
jgi:hypothetical protein